MNLKVCFRKDGSFEIPSKMKIYFKKGTPYTLMLVEGKGLLFVQRHIMGYTVDIPLLYGIVEKDGFLKLPTAMIRQFQKYNLEMICNDYGGYGVFVFDERIDNRCEFKWETRYLAMTLNPFEILHRPFELVVKNRKQRHPKFIVNRRNRNEKEEKDVK